MTYYDSLSFVYQLVLERFDFPPFVYATILFLSSLFLGHLLWGFLWNRQWRFALSIFAMIASIMIASLLFITGLFWSAADRSMTWVDLQRKELSRQYTESGTRNRRIFQKVQVHITGDENFVGNTLILRNESDTLTLATIAASDVTCPLTNHGPLGPGAPCRVRDAATVAEEVVRNIPVNSYPITVLPKNRWVEAAVSAQLNESLNYAGPRLHTGMAELKQALVITGILFLFIQLLVVAHSAVSDIRINPSLKEHGMS
jgi:hypothetical protein